VPLTLDEYRCLQGFSVLYSGGLDSAAVALMIGSEITGPVHLLTYEHRYGALFNEWSRRHNPDMQRILGDRVFHHLVDHTRIWDEIGATRMLQDGLKYKGHFVVCLGCQQAMATHTILHDLEHNITNAFICSSVGGEYAAMSMPVTREKNIEFYARYGIRYNAPLLDLGINKNEERIIMKRFGVEPGWGRRRSHQGYQPICLIGFQHTLDILFDWHTTYPPDRVAEFLDDKALVMDRIIRRGLIERGHDPDALIERNLRKYAEEEAAIQRVRAEREAALEARRRAGPP